MLTRRHPLRRAFDRGALVLFLLSQLNLFALADTKPSGVFATGVRTSVEGEATRITVFGTAPLAHSVRRVDERTLVVELPGVDAGKLSPSYLSDSPLVSGVSVRCDRAPSGDALARFLVALRQPARERSYLSGNDLILELTPLAPAPNAAQPAASAPQPNSAAAAALAPMDQQPRPTPAPSSTPNVLITRPEAGTPDAAQRGALAPASQGQHYGEYGFVGEPINLNVVNADIRDILNYITEQYGVNFVIDSSVGAIPVTVNVTDVPWNLALDSILRANRLGIEVTGNILRVATLKVLTEEAASQQSINEAKLDASPLVTEFIRLNYARGTGTLANAAGASAGFEGARASGTSDNATGGALNGNSGGGQNGGQSSSGGAGNGGDQGILPIVQRRLSRRGSVEVDGRSNTLIVTDVRENIASIRQLVSLLDQPEPQVEIETRIVIANRNFSRDLGVQLSAGVQSARGGLGNINTITPVAPQTTGQNPFGVFGGLANTIAPGAGLRANAPSTVIGLTTGLIGTAQISAEITAAETRGQAKIVADPRVTALNNRPAQIESGSQIPVVTPQTSGGGGGNGAVIFTTTYISVPLRLSVTPQITDAGTVILRITAENNSVNLSLTNSLGTPGIDTQRMTTEVLVPDGGTTIVGGVLADSEGETTNRTPGLGGLPVLGNLFKRRATNRTTNELLFFITPRIYRPDYNGRPTSGTVADRTRSATIPQPVSLGNPQSNTPPPGAQPPTQPTGNLLVVPAPATGTRPPQPEEE